MRRSIFNFTRVLRKWPKLRRRVIIARRCYHKAYWYLYEFKEEFINEYYRVPRELDRRARELEGPRDESPLYYQVYIAITVSNDIIAFSIVFKTCHVYS